MKEAKNYENKVEVSHAKIKQETKMIRKKTYFVCEENRVVKRFNPHTLVKEPLLLVVMLLFIYSIAKQIQWGRLLKAS